MSFPEEGNGRMNNQLRAQPSGEMHENKQYAITVDLGPDAISAGHVDYFTAPGRHCTAAKNIGGAASLPTPTSSQLLCLLLLALAGQGRKD